MREQGSSNASTGTTTIKVRLCLSRIQRGDLAARSDLIEHAANRLRKLATQRLWNDFGSLVGYIEVNEVVNEAVIRLRRMLDRLTPNDAGHFFALCARNVRWRLLKLAKRARRHLVEVDAKSAHPSRHADPNARSPEFAMHVEEVLEQLPSRLRQVFELRYYGGHSEDETAEILGVSIRTVSRRYREAKIEIGRLLGGDEKI